MARRRKGSQGWREAACQVARLHARIADRRRDVWRKRTRQPADTYGPVALDDLTRAFMTANRRLSLRAHDAGPAEAQHLPAHNAEEAGTQVVAPPADTSQVCSACGAVVEKDGARSCPSLSALR